MTQYIDVITLTILGIFYTASTAFIIWFNARSFPSEDARTLKIWALGLSLQPFAWLSYGYRGNELDPFLTIIANAFLIGGFAVMTKAVRKFLGAKGVDLIIVLLLITVTIAVAVFTLIWPNFSATVIINSIGLIIAFCLMLMPLKSSIKSYNSSSQKIIFFVVLIGVTIIILRMIHHFLAPSVGGNLLEASILDTFAVIYAAAGPVLASYGFLLLHQERAYNQLASMAEKDSLTGILNRQAFAQQANRYFTGKKLVDNTSCLVLIDIDHFKKINDTYGHHVGDQVLKQCSNLFKTILRKNDIIGRMGGEEFMIMLPNTYKIEAAKVAQEILSKISQSTFKIDKISINITVSIGLAKRKHYETHYDQALKRADFAMYKAKNLGRNQIVLAD